MSIQCFIFPDLLLVLSVAFSVNMLESILNMNGFLLSDTTFTHLHVRYSTLSAELLLNICLSDHKPRKRKALEETLMKEYRS